MGEFLKSSAMANYLLAVEHLAIFFVMSWKLYTIYHRYGKNSPRHILLAFAIFWVTGALMHGVFAADLIATGERVIWLRVFTTPFSFVGWWILLRWIEHWLELMDGRAAAAERRYDAAYEEGRRVGIEEERTRLLGPGSKVKPDVSSTSATVEAMQQARAKLKQTIEGEGQC